MKSSNMFTSVIPQAANWCSARGVCAIWHPGFLALMLFI